MTDTSKEAVERMAYSIELGSIGPQDTLARCAAMLRALLSERDTAFNAGIEAAAKVASEISNRLKSENDTHKMYEANQVWHAIRALAKGE